MAVEITMDIDELVRPHGYSEKWKKHSIYRIPYHMKDENPKAYTPQLISIGPYHYGAPHLAALQAHKAVYLQRFLERTNKPLKYYIDALEPLTDELLDSYQLLDESWTANRTKFLTLMVLDGVFLNELARSYLGDKEPNLVFNLDSIRNFSNEIMPDLLKMENQIPHTVLRKLALIQTSEVKQKLGEEEAHHDEEKAPLHLVDEFKALIIARYKLKSTDKYLNPFTSVKSASELQDAGVQFRVIGDSTRCSRGISFKHGTLSLPPLTIDSSTESEFLNAISFEKLHNSARREISSYVSFMQGLISSANDVRILASGGLIVRSRGRKENIVNSVNKISKDVLFDPHSELCEVRDSLNEYYANKMKSKKHRMKLLLLRWWKNLLQTHFKSPWTILSLLAATVLLFLTLLQTIYTLKSYYD